MGAQQLTAYPGSLVSRQPFVDRIRRVGIVNVGSQLGAYLHNIAPYEPSNTFRNSQRSSR